MPLLFWCGAVGKCPADLTADVFCVKCEGYWKNYTRFKEYIYSYYFYYIG